MTKEEDLGCGKCSVRVPDDAAIACEGLCNKWFDLKCAKLTYDEYNMINDLSNKVKWFCTVCTKNVSDLMKFKLVQNKEDWPSILHVVLAGVQGNSDVTLDLSNRLQEMEKKENDTRLTLANLVCEVSHLRETVDKYRPSSRLGPIPSPDRDGPISENDARLNNTEPPVSVRNLGLGLNTSDEDENVQELNDTSYDRQFPSLEGSRPKPSTDINEWEVVDYKRNKVDRGQSPRYGSRPSNTKDTHRPSLNKPERSSTGQGSDSRRWPMNNRKGQGVTTATKRNTPAIIGKKKTVDGITAAEKISWLFLSRLGPTVSVESIRDHVSKLCEDKVIQCEELQTRYKSYKSFKVGCPVQYYDKLMDGEMWPEGILVTKFVPQRKFFNQNTNDGGGPRPRGAYGLSQMNVKNSH